MRPRLKRPKAKSAVKAKRRLPDKVGKMKNIYNLVGSLLMVGTEAEWRKWVKSRR